MNWHAAMKWARIRSVSCDRRIVPGHRHRVVGFRTRWGGGRWSYAVHCTTRASRYRRSDHAA